MRTLALLLLLGCATVAQAQPPKTLYAVHASPRRRGDDPQRARRLRRPRRGSRLTVRGVDVKADGGSNETFTVAAPALRAGWPSSSPAWRSCSR